MKSEKICEESIKNLVDGFYNKVRQNPELSYLFENKIGKTKEEWQPHLQKMYDFWSSVMTSSGKYKGNPMKKHKDLPAFEKGRFDLWLELFSQTAHEIYCEEVAEEFIAKSKNIAKSLKYGLYECG